MAQGDLAYCIATVHAFRAIAEVADEIEEYEDGWWEQVDRITTQVLEHLRNLEKED